mmetsp:Transcript_31022/g.49759  ORF Transcript_31022/g.49759 Transcript_31022/m.49759 type:complete len:218 (-) Transcript_31022:511-1164(-)
MRNPSLSVSEPARSLSLTTSSQAASRSRSSLAAASLTCYPWTMSSRRTTDLRTFPAKQTRPCSSLQSPQQTECPAVCLVLCQLTSSLPSCYPQSHPVSRRTRTHFTTPSITMRNRAQCTSAPSEQEPSASLRWFSSTSSPTSAAGHGLTLISNSVKSSIVHCSNSALICSSPLRKMWEIEPQMLLRPRMRLLKASSRVHLPIRSFRRLTCIAACAPT